MRILITIVSHDFDLISVNPRMCYLIKLKLQKIFLPRSEPTGNEFLIFILTTRKTLIYILFRHEKWSLIRHQGIPSIDNEILKQLMTKVQVSSRHIG